MFFKIQFSWTGRRSISSSPSPSAEDWTLLDQPSRQRSSGDLSPPIRSGKIVTAFNKLKVGVRRSKQIDEPVCQPGVCFKCKQVKLISFFITVNILYFAYTIFGGKWFCNKLAWIEFAYFWISECAYSNTYINGI